MGVDSFSIYLQEEGSDRLYLKATTGWRAKPSAALPQRRRRLDRLDSHPGQPVPFATP